MEETTFIKGVKTRNAVGLVNGNVGRATRRSGLGDNGAPIRSIQTLKKLARATIPAFAPSAGPPSFAGQQRLHLLFELLLLDLELPLPLCERLFAGRHRR